MTNIEEFLEQITKLKTAVEQIASEQKNQAAGPPFKIVELCDRSVEFTPREAEGGTIVLVSAAEHMCVGPHWVDFDGRIVTHEDMDQRVRRVLAMGGDVTLLHRG